MIWYLLLISDAHMYIWFVYTCIKPPWNTPETKWFPLGKYLKREWLRRHSHRITFNTAQRSCWNRYHEIGYWTIEIMLYDEICAPEHQIWLFHSSFFFLREQPWGTPKFSFSAIFNVLEIRNMLCAKHFICMIWYQKFAVKSWKQRCIPRAYI